MQTSKCQHFRCTKIAVSHGSLTVNLDEQVWEKLQLEGGKLHISAFCNANFKMLQNRKFAHCDNNLNFYEFMVHIQDRILGCFAQI